MFRTRTAHNHGNLQEAKMDYQGRLGRLRHHMDERGIDLVYLARGANLFYLTGIRRELEHGTDHNAYGDWACGGYIGQQDAVLIAPRMGGGFYVAEAEGKPWISDVRIVDEREDPAAVMREVIDKVAPNPRGIAVDDRTWAQTSLALTGLCSNARFSLASEMINPMRAIKDPDEIEVMTRASHLADQVWERISRSLRRGVAEYEVAIEIERLFQEFGAEYTSFPTGVFFNGPSDLHAEGTTRASQHRTLQPGDSVMFDFGCVLDGYCSDFGRCAYVGEPPQEYLDVHNLILESQRVGIESLRAGELAASEVNARARTVIEDAGHGEAFTHRLGHAMGVTVHEPPFMDVVDQTVVQENMVFTVEPSIVYQGRFANRVEDVVVVTPNGGRVLNQASHDLVIVD
jgi:Xaa-Pro dipeptidase